MSLSIDKRKRCREGDFICESMPLSKRINNLHLSERHELERFENMVEPLQQPHPTPSISHHYQQPSTMYQQQQQHFVQHNNNNHLPQDYILKGISQSTRQHHSTTPQTSSYNVSCSNSATNHCSITSSNSSACRTTTTSMSSVMNGSNLHVDVDLQVATSDIYNPELNENENPFYYMKNKLLHELHLERSRRCQMTNPDGNPNVFHL